MKLLLLILSIIFSLTYQSILEHCDDFIGDKEYFCSRLKGDNGENCVLINNDCKEYFFKCSEYTGSDKDECEAIKIYDKKTLTIKSQSYCKWQSNSCVQILRECDDKDLPQCATLEDSDADVRLRRCGTINDKCAEYVDDCSSITTFDSSDTDKKKCIENLPSDSINKCKWGKKTQEDTVDLCYSDYTKCEEYVGPTSSICTGLTANDKDKICLFLENKCLERYKSCGLAKNENDCMSTIPLEGSNPKPNYICKWKIPNGKTENECVEEEIVSEVTECPSAVDKTKCEETILSDDHMRCVYSGSSCIKKEKKCSYFKEIPLEKKCNSYTPYFTKKCVFTNGNCLDQNKSCNELSSANGVNADICLAAPTSDSTKKKCSLKSDGSGCEEVDIPQASSSKTSSEESNQNNRSENIKSKLIFVFIYLLFL